MGEAEFKLRYRVSWESFNKLLKILEPKLRVDNERQACNSRQGIPVELPTRLAIALRYFAGGDPLDLKLIYGVSKAFVMTCVWRAVDAINGCLDNAHFPLDDPAGLAALEADFAAASRGGFWRGQVGAIDGIHIRMQAPSSSDVNDPLSYHMSRKDIYALLCMAICDANRRFIWADISKAPQTHDSTAWSATELGQRIEKGDLPYPYFINGDAAFTLGPSMLTPSNNDPELDNYDFYQSSNRMAIECAFGILVRRWGVLWRPLRQEFSRRAPLVIALMHLHNFCIDERLASNSCDGEAEGMPDVQAPIAQCQPGRFRRPPKFDKDGRPVQMLDTCRAHDEGAPTRRERQQAGIKVNRRNEMVQAIKDAGYTRVLRCNDDVVRKHKNPKGAQKGAKRKK